MIGRVPDVSCPKLFVTRRSVPGFLKKLRVRYHGIGLVLVLGLGVSARVGVYGLGLEARLESGGVVVLR